MATARHLRLGKGLAAVNGTSEFAGVYRIGATSLTRCQIVLGFWPE